MPTPFVVHFIGIAPIPIGHQVEIRVFLLDTAVFGMKLEPQLDDPLIIDLGTGVVYGADWQFEVGNSQLNYVRPSMPLVPRADLQEHGRWRGVVTATRVAVIGGGRGQSSWYMQTSLAVTPHDDQKPYR